jgi:hypothetical protein
MKLLVLLFLAPVLYGQVPGLVTVQVGALSCGAVMRSATTIQTYCYGPAGPPVTVYNELLTIFNTAVPDYLWCAGGVDTNNKPLPMPAGCTAIAHITWSFQIVPTGIAWQYTIDASTIVSGTLTKVYGSP